jgi:tetratricopeptide (TPR) repeat protein
VEPEPEVESLDPEFMAMLELTMPKAEEEPVPIPEPEPLSLPEFSEPVEIAVALESPEEIFDTPIEIAPSLDEPLEIVEEPPVVEPDPLALMSAEERAEIAQTQQADMLESSLTGADAASKIAAYRKALEETPDNLVLRTRLADIHLKYGLLEDAVVQYRQVMRRSPDSIPLLHRVIQAEFWNENYVEAGDSLLALAKLHLKRGEQHEALDTLQSVLSLDPLHFEARKELVSVFTALDESKLAAHHLRQLAETALTKGEIEGAIQAFQQLLEISADPTFEERLAQIYESQGDVAKALSSFQSLVGRYRAEERWEEAARVTERIVELDPNLLEDREGLIALYKHLGESKRAVEQQFLLARLYQERSDLERAISLYEEVLKFQVDNQDARRHLVDAYLDSGRVSAALEQAEALTEHYLDTKDHSTAIYLYSRLVDADPENVELQERLVKFYGLAGDPENAKTRWVQISNLHERHGRFERAAEAVQKALELDESQIELQHRLALLYAERLQDNQSALTQLRKLFQIAPDRLDAVKMYIDLLLREEQVSEAGQVLQRLEQTGGDGAEIKANVIALLKASVESNPTNLKARFNYGELCYHLGDLDHAIEQFQQTRRHPDYELLSYNMLGLCFASKKGYMMLDLAIKQFQKGLETKGRSEQDYLEIRYNLAMVQYQNGRAKEALAELKECYNVDIAYRDVRSWIQKIEGELASGT